MVEVRDNQVFHKHFIKQRVNCALALDEKTHEKLLVGTNQQLFEYNISTRIQGRCFSQGTSYSIKRVNEEIIIVKKSNLTLLLKNLVPIRTFNAQSGTWLPPDSLQVYPACNIESYFLLTTDYRPY
jgi:hypothetical protein